MVFQIFHIFSMLEYCNTLHRSSPQEETPNNPTVRIDTSTFSENKYHIEAPHQNEEILGYDIQCTSYLPA